MSFIPIISLLNGVSGSGYLSHAINLYLRYKPPIEELHQFLDFQLPRQWAPLFSDLPLGPQREQQSTASLQFSFFGPKLYVNTNPVDVGNMPVTGLRLYLGGERNIQLEIHLQHFSALPKCFQIDDSVTGIFNSDSDDHTYYEKVQGKNFDHVCIAPVESEDKCSIVTGAQLHVGDHGFKKSSSYASTSRNYSAALQTGIRHGMGHQARKRNLQFLPRRPSSCNSFKSRTPRSTNRRS